MKKQIDPDEMEKVKEILQKMTPEQFDQFALNVMAKASSLVKRKLQKMKDEK